MSLQAEFSNLHQSLGEDKACHRWEGGSVLQSCPRQRASSTGRLRRCCGLDIASSQVHKVDRFQGICFQGTQYRMTFQINFIFTTTIAWSRSAVFRAWWLQSDCLQHAAYVTRTVVMSKCQAAARSARALSAQQEGVQASAPASSTFATVRCSPSGYRDPKQNKSDVISGPEAYWHSTAWIPMAKIPYSPTQSSHTWIAFGDGSRPMLTLDQHPGTAWETPHRHAQKACPERTVQTS